MLPYLVLNSHALLLTRPNYSRDSLQDTDFKRVLSKITSFMINGMGDN